MLKHLKKVVQKSVHISHWIALSEWMRMAHYLLVLTKRWRIISSKGTQVNEDFLMLTQKLALSEADLLKRQAWFKHLFKMWLSFSGITLLYGVYLITIGAWLNTALISILEVMMLSQAFQYHFWSFQIEKRQCGCSVKEWALFTFGNWYTQ